MDGLIVKWLHILSSTLLFGTGIGSAFLLFAANRGRDIASIRFATRHVVRADWLFTAPAVVIQLASGFYLAERGGFDLSESWLATALALYGFIGLCWLPVVWIQIRMRDIAKADFGEFQDVPDCYWVYGRWWIVLGSLALPATGAIFWLMVAKAV